MSSVVGIVHSNELLKLSNLSPKYENRFSLVMGLIFAYDLTKNLTRIPPLEMCSSKELNYLTLFHSEDYVHFLRLLDKYYESDDEPKIPDDISESFDEYGLSYDCHGFKGVFSFALAAVRGTLAAADCLINSQCQIVINWAGGWHHAKRSEASGFCYLNDVVLGIQHLLSAPKFSSGPILYIDLDLHHGDGVEEAFAYSHRVITFSVHHGAPGFFPGTGVPSGTGEYFVGARGGRFSCFNLALAEGANDETWWSGVEPILTTLHASLHPLAVVIQCGADALSSDPHRTFNLSASLNAGQQMQSGYVSALRLVLSWHLPTLILGGGGYHLADTARLWLMLTSLAVSSVTHEEVKIDQDIPEHDNFSSFGPDFTLDVHPSMRPDLNSSVAVDKEVKRLLKQIDNFCELHKS
nr:histone deacetylase 8 [Hymenolepis microstoma]